MSSPALPLIGIPLGSLGVFNFLFFSPFPSSCWLWFPPFLRVDPSGSSPTPAGTNHRFSLPLVSNRWRPACMGCAVLPPPPLKHYFPLPANVIPTVNMATRVFPVAVNSYKVYPSFLLVRPVPPPCAPPPQDWTDGELKPRSLFFLPLYCKTPLFIGRVLPLPRACTMNDCLERSTPVFSLFFHDPLF